ncbi:hypothetical protein ACLB2K_031608 [Fragaria x ananassa]
MLLLTSLFLLSGRLFKRQKANTILLTGLSGSGKTVLFYQLQDGSSHQGTVTSMEPNEGTFVLHSEKSKNGKVKPVHLVDVPGHSHLRPKLDEFLPQTAGIVFVVDSLEFLPNCRSASDAAPQEMIRDNLCCFNCHMYLYDILTKATVLKKKIPVLILCNKTDKVTAHSKEFIRKQLEKELDKLRASRSAISTADIANDFTLGVIGEPFSFPQCQNKVKVAEGAGIDDNLIEVEQFIRDHWAFSVQDLRKAWISFGPAPVAFLAHEGWRGLAARDVNFIQKILIPREMRCPRGILISSLHGTLQFLARRGGERNLSEIGLTRVAWSARLAS